MTDYYPNWVIFGEMKDRYKPLIEGAFYVMKGLSLPLLYCYW